MPSTRSDACRPPIPTYAVHTPRQRGPQEIRDAVAEIPPSVGPALATPLHPHPGEQLRVTVAIDDRVGDIGEPFRIRDLLQDPG